MGDDDQEDVIEQDVLAEKEREEAFNFTVFLRSLMDRTSILDPSQKKEAQPFIQHEINARCQGLGLDEFVYSEEALNGKLETVWNGVKKSFSTTQKASSSVLGWLRGDGKELVSSGVGKVKQIREKRQEAREVTIDPGLAHQIKEGAALYEAFRELVDQHYADYADQRSSASKALKRLKPGTTLVKGLDGYSITDGNKALATLDEQIKTLREGLNTTKRQARNAKGPGSGLLGLIRELDVLSDFLEETVNFIEVLEKDEAQWEGDQERLKRLLDDDKTVVSGAEGFLKMTSDTSVATLLRFSTTLIRFISSTVSQTHKAMAAQQ